MRQSDIIGIINCNSNFEDLYPLTIDRSSACIPFLGKFRLIDFTLSSLVSSSCSNIALYPGSCSRSLHDHIENGTNWGLNKNRDGIFIHDTYFEAINGVVTYKMLEKNINHLYRSNQKYVVIGHASCVHMLDFEAILDRHIKSEANISIITKDSNEIGYYVLSKELLINLILTSVQYFEVDILQTIKARKSLHINKIEITGFYEAIDSVSSLFRVSMDLVGLALNSNGLKLPKIYTKRNYTIPTKYNEGSKIHNSVIANGCKIYGEIFNSVLFRRVTLGSKSNLKGSIIMANVKIGSNVVLENVIVDKNVVIKDGVVIIGSKETPTYIKKGEVITVEDCLYNK